MLARKVHASFRRCLAQHPPATGSATVVHNTGPVDFDGFVILIGNKVPYEDGWPVPFGKERYGFSCSSECNIKEPSFFGVVERLRLRKHQVEQRIIRDLGWKTQTPCDRAQDNHVIGFKPLRSVDGHEPN
jgi:hypothetical protein